jgi:acetyl-CoA synthetase
MGTQALRSRIVDSGAKVIVATDFTYPPRPKISLKPTVDEAVRDLYLRRARRRPPPRLAPRRRAVCQFESVRDHDFYDVQNPREIHCHAGARWTPNIPSSSSTPPAPRASPKGVVHATGGYMVGVTYLSRAFYQIGERDIYWSTSDIGWIVGHSFIVYGPLSVGATVFCREGVPDYPTPEVTWELVRTLRRQSDVHRANGAPHVDEPRRGGAEEVRPVALRLLACAGEPLNPEAHLWAQTHLVGQGGGMVVDNWWQTEIAGPVLGTLPTFEARPSKVGKPMPGAVVDVVDRDGKSLPDGQGGLLVLREPLPYMLRTVWGDDERYRQYWRQVPGCYAAGDIAVRDRDGYFAVLGRADDVMNVAGHRIGTAEVESSLLRHPSVAESAVIGLPDDVKGERIKAFVVLKPGEAPGPGLIGSLKDHVRQDLGPIAQPSDIEIRAVLPKTRSGKIVRRFLKAQELGEDPGDLSTLAD